MNRHDVRQPNASKSVDVHYADALRAKALLDDMMEDLSQGTSGLWVRSVPVKEKDSIKRKAANDYGGEVRRYDDVLLLLCVYIRCPCRCRFGQTMSQSYM